ncbi:allophanate hydrolase [Sodalis ligni]|uniref:Allophanate hydrolase n=1 Tax=Sodalis ligni TaxID=2697027 RepID=A0A4R1NG29_9GAMM|nr:allophanate hydrolase [Sodalis ligni]TCL05909.1 allophanate hydrolase [Sodalis ligni]
MSAYAIATLQGRLQRGEITLSGLVRVLCESLERGQPDIWIHRLTAAELQDRAAGLEALAEGYGASLYQRMPLYGVPFAVKDNIDVAGLPTTAACPEYRYIADNDAFVVRRLLDAGAILVGKTNLDQFATGLVGVRSPYGLVRNAVNPAYVAGGSSSGSAVAVASGLVAFALGTDTAGSGRVPAGFNGLVGLKPSRGLLSGAGVVPACLSLDCVSIFAADAASAWRVTRVAAGYDADDPRSRRLDMLPVRRRHRRVAIPAACEFFGDRQAEAAFAAAVDVLRRQPDITLREVPFAVFAEAAELLYDGPWVAERQAAIGDFYQTRAEAIHPVVKGIIAKADQFSAVDVFTARYRLDELIRQASLLLAETDLLVVPTAPCMPTIEAVLADPVRINSRLGYYTNFVNLMDMAALAMPAPARGDGLPAGITLIGPAGADHYLAATAAAWQGLFGAEDQSGQVTATPLPFNEPSIEVAVVGAHLSGEPLNWQLIERGARKVGDAFTAGRYQLYALANSQPAKPGLVRVSEGGESIALEIWQMPLRCFGAFVADVPPPLGIGSVELANGQWIKGFICESAGLTGAVDITGFKGWRNYRATV